MGQQQLLLLVLGIVIVGLAVVVGIQAFSENQKKANTDSLVSDAIRIASDAQAWRLKPAAFGGGAGNASTTPWTGLTLKQMGYEIDSSTEYANLNGNFKVNIATTTFEIRGYSTSLDNAVLVKVTGTTPDDITTTVCTEAADTACNLSA